MARVLLIAPPAIEPVKTPLLAFAYLVAALRRGGHEAFVLDASGSEPETIGSKVRALAPDLVGIHLKTLEVQHGYALARSLASEARLVAGGPHATVRHEEPLGHGFHYVLRGEADETLVELASAIDGRRELSEVGGLTWRDRGLVRSTARRPFLRDLDTLPDPLSALDAFDPRAYRGIRSPAGLLSSRGCPAACTFCSNDVTGRTFRYHSPERVAREARTMKEELGASAFAFFDDSFAVGRRRVRSLGRALAEVGVSWTCTAHPSHLDMPTLRAMKDAGCSGIDIGMESADRDRLLRIGKGVTVEHVLDVLRMASDLGLHVIVNAMVMWPDETRAELDALSSFLDRAAPMCGGFNSRGVLVPHPGTPEYELHHETCGFTAWWTREPPLPYEPFPSSWDKDEILRAYAADAALDRNFFRHSSAHVAHARDILAQKAALTLDRVTEWTSPSSLAHGSSPPAMVPAAGAR